MKKFLLILSLLIVLPSFAACSIDIGESVCSLPNVREPFSPIFSSNENISDFSDSPVIRLNPIKHGEIESEFRNFSPNESNYNYNSSCQFGVCMENRNNTLFQQQKPRQ